LALECANERHTTGEAIGGVQRIRGLPRILRRLTAAQLVGERARWPNPLRRRLAERAHQCTMMHLLFVLLGRQSPCGYGMIDAMMAMPYSSGNNRQ
jgi:hypothetical protein